MDTMELRLSVLLSLCLLLGLICPNWAHKGRCPRKQSCNKCIQAGPECAWCNEPDITGPRCNTEDKLLMAGCGGHIYNPKGGLLSITNESRTQEDKPVRATVVQLTLRPGVVQSVILTLPKDQQRTTEVTMETGPVPEHVNITFNHTDRPWVQQVNVEATSCPRGNGSWAVTIKPKGFALLLELQLTFECMCECMKSSKESSPACSGRGSPVCGQCECDASYTGSHCERSRRRLPQPPSPGDERCRERPGAPVCSGRGTCEEGSCICDTRADPAERYSGKYCECSNFDCLYSNGRLCGGHGECSCGECVCDVGWTNEDCDCSMDSAPCIGTNGMICSGRGNCQCAKCVCGFSYQGATCENRPSFAREP